METAYKEMNPGRGKKDVIVP